MSDYQLNDTIVAVATAAGKSGIAVIRLSGPDAIQIASSLLKKPETLFTSLPNSGFYSEFISSGGELIDDGVVMVFRAPHSFTGEDVVEIGSHGSLAIADVIVLEFIRTGARPAEPGEFSRRAFYNGKLALKDLEIITARIAATDGAALRGSERSVDEKFSRLDALYRLLIGMLGDVNAEIDFGESDAIKIPALTQRIGHLLAKVNDLLRIARNKSANAGYFTVALTGPTNVGKSSIFNALVAFKRSIVSDTPGTTRDYLEAFIDLPGGHRIKLVDTAGDRRALGEIEREGIILGQTAALEADLTFRVTDPSDRSPQIPDGLLLLHNKNDLDGWNEQVSISALTGQGLELLRSEILIRAIATDSELSKPALSMTERSQLEDVAEKLHRLVDSPLSDPGLLADDLQSMIDVIGSLLGLNISEDALNHIFTNMCIGK